MEHHPGKLDYWPVHPLKQAPSNLSLGQAPSDSSVGNPGHATSTQEYIPIVPKPKFLDQLESYLQKELRLLGCPPYGPHELRLQAHREVFEYLIEDFKTYKPLLSAIKNEYELYLEYQEEMIKELEPMRVGIHTVHTHLHTHTHTHMYTQARLKTVREECEQKIVMLREGEKQGNYPSYVLILKAMDNTNQRPSLYKILLYFRGICCAERKQAITGSIGKKEVGPLISPIHFTTPITV